MITCEKCGFENPEGSKYCAHCGESLYMSLERNYEYWCTRTPGYIVYLIDLSDGMKEKIDDLIDALERTFMRMISICVQGTRIKERVAMTVIGYNTSVKVIWKDMRMEDLAKKLIERRKRKIPIFDKNAEFKTEYDCVMSEGLDAAKRDIRDMIQSKNKRGMGEDILTPIVVHITNGSLSDSYYSSYQDNLDSILNSARNLINGGPSGRRVKLFNIKYGKFNDNEEEIIFPSQRPNRPVDRVLNDISTPMSDIDIKELGYSPIEVSKGARFAALNVSKGATLEWLLNSIK